MPDGGQRSTPRVLHPTMVVGPNEPPRPSQPGALWYDTSSDLGALVDLPGCELSGSPTIASGSDINVTFSSKTRDSHGYWVSGTRATVPVGMGGWYLLIARISGGLSAQSQVGSYYHLMFRKNGVVFGPDSHLFISGQWQYPNTRTIEYIYLAPGDYIEVRASNFSGQSWPAAVQFSMVRMGGIPGLQGVPGGQIERAVSFPSSPYLGQRIRRTDIRGGMDFEWDGTYWLSVQQFSYLIDGEGITTQTNLFRRFVLPDDLQTYVVRIHGRAYVVAPNGGANFWAVTLSWNPVADGSVTNFATAGTASNTAQQWDPLTFTGWPQLLPSNAYICRAIATYGGSPGLSFYPKCEMVTRLRAT